MASIGATSAAVFFAMITFFSVFGDIQSCQFNIFDWSQADDHFHRNSNTGGPDQDQRHGQQDRLELLEDQRLEETVFDIILEVESEVPVGRVSGQCSCQESAQCPTNRVDSKRVQRIVITEPRLDLVAEEKRNDACSNAN